MIDIIEFIFNSYDKFFHLDSLVFNMSSNNNSNIIETTSHSTQVRIINDDGSWSSSIRSLFIYGTGALRVAYSRTPQGRVFTIVSTLLADSGSVFLNNAVNDPTYIRRHAENWSVIWNRISNSNDVEVSVYTNRDPETANAVDAVVNSQGPGDVSNSFLPIPEGLSDFSNNLLSTFIGSLKHILEPVTVDYSNELLAEQIYGISIVLFVMVVCVLILFISFVFNVVILIFSDTLKKYFTNKYILWYIDFNKRIIGLEVAFLSITIISSLFSMAKGIQFIATHPINFS